jgi:endo-1,4-beta-mannosidase
MQAQIILAQEVASAIGDHPALWAYDLGNENSNCVVPPARDAAIEWLERMTDALREVDKSHSITIGLHMEDLEEDRRLGPAEAARVCDFLSMHGYPMYARWARSPEDPAVAPFLAHLTAWLGGKEVLFEEIGAPALPRAANPVPPVIEEEKAATLISSAVLDLIDLGCIGAMIWCYGDYAESLWKEPPLDEAVHERYFGVWRNNGSPKPVLSKFVDLMGQPIKKRQDAPWINIDRSEFYSAPFENLTRLYKMYIISNGTREEK